MSPPEPLPHGHRPRLLVLVRHGQSMHQAIKAGNVDYPDTPEARELAQLADHQVPLTPLGRQQAQLVGRMLKAQFGPFHKCYDSGYARAIETRREALQAGYGSEAIAAMSIRSELLLRERETGLLRNLTAERKKLIPLMDLWEWEFAANPFQTRPLGGESIADVTDRVRQFRSLVIEHHSGENILVFCHGIVMKAFRIVLLRQDITTAIDTCRMDVPNTAVHAYRPSETGWTIQEFLPPF